MKKLLAILMVICIIAAVAACGGNEEAPGSSAPAASSPPAGGESSAPAGSSPSQAPPASPPAEVIVIEEGWELPNLDFQLKLKQDPFSRPTYQILHVVMAPGGMTSALLDALNEIGQALNFEVTQESANRQAEEFINLIEVYAGQGIDGMLLEAEVSNQDRVLELARDLDIKWLTGLGSIFTGSLDDPHWAWPAVQMDDFNMGFESMNWMIDNWERFTGTPFEAEKIGAVSVFFSTPTVHVNRSRGAAAAYEARFPNLVSSNFIELDTVAEANPVSQAAGAGVMGPHVAANPQFEGWIVFGTAEDNADGAATSLVEMGFGDMSMVTTRGAGTLLRLWEGGYEGNYVAAADASTIQWAHGLMAGLLMLIEGTETPETLWQSYKQPGQTYTMIRLPFSMIELDNSQLYRDAVAGYKDTITWEIVP